MNFGESINACIKKSLDFSGRATRSEYWWFMLAQTALAIIAFLFGRLAIKVPVIGWPLYFIVLLAYIAMLLPLIAVTVRRLHDTGRSGWFIFFGFIPIAGMFVLIYFYTQPSSPNPNQWGK